MALTKHTSSPERMMLTNITGLIKQAEECEYTDDTEYFCPLMGPLLAIKKSLQTEVKNLGEDDREVKA